MCLAKFQKTPENPEEFEVVPFDTPVPDVDKVVITFRKPSPDTVLEVKDLTGKVCISKYHGRARKRILARKCQIAMG